ncbi:hypothetical protein KAJ27_08870 [bacterium]|nr:hypothetical protein [bacterium]
MKVIYVILLVTLFVVSFNDISYCQETVSADQLLLEEAEVIRVAFQNYLNKHIKKMPLILFPESKIKYLENLRDLMAEEYFIVPEVRNVTFKKKEKKYRIDRDVYKNMEFVFSNFLVKGMPIDRVSINFTGVVLDQERLNKKEFRIMTANSAIFTMEVTADELGKFIHDEAGKQGTIIPPLSVDGKDIVLNGMMKFMDYEGEVFVNGTTYVDKKNMMRFKIKKCKTGKNSVPGFIIDTISNMVNPMLFFEKFMFGLTTTEIIIKGKKIFLIAEAMKFKRKKYEVKYKSKSLLKYLNK